ncbi:phospholipid/cholesterol/gamma-HCH transport system substrate-binding protein [Thermomonospora echinospora]|uniref:Phospholipid/cholesterol/gamma-HCH transport system substrate-binding protein n=1 Tax=Thermomonospora echinospora TaxID=1992 RepID=A0A1H6DA80_9ACTN|nr:phospholipid/cholesterol/gamma-HCH transport system substrate-binding protein [Thermomonospora echinospora]
MLLALVSTAGCSLQTLGAPKGGMTLYAVFDDVQNLVVGHGVQMYDVRVGSVTGIRLRGYRVRVTLSLVDGTRVPAGTGATIARTSLLGENYVRLTPPPGSAPRTAPLLAAGSEITRTGVQPDLERITERVGPVLAALGGENLNEIIDGLASGLGGTGPRLHRIIERAAEISAGYAAAGEDLREVLDGMGRLSEDLAADSAALDRLPGSLLEMTERVDKDRAELKQALTGLTELAESAGSVIGERHGARLRKLLLRLDAVLGAMIRGKEDLKAATGAVLNKLLKTPRITHEGQALAYAWIGGFLPGRTTPRRDFGQQLERLLAPK